MKLLCAYCGGLKEYAGVWHDCPQAHSARCRLDATISSIQVMMGKPALTELSEDPIARRYELRERNQRLASMATQIKLNGGRVKPEFE